MVIEFTKMTGAGNDFIVVDNRDGALSGFLSPGFIASICRRRLSVGADGLLELLPPIGSEAFRMGYYNADGGRAAMCGNGARCICCFAVSLGIAAKGEEFTFSSDSGTHRGMVTDDGTARVWMTEPRVFFLERPADIGIRVEVSLVDTGVPHAVVIGDDLENGDFERFAPVLRNHPLTGPNGANADWVLRRPDGSIHLRTFERGVEGETLACGTGAVAAVLVCGETRGGIRLPALVRVRSGLYLKVGRDGFGWWLEGQARAVYKGSLDTGREGKA